MSRYSGRKKFINNSEYYSPLLEKRGISSLRQYGTPRLNHISPNQVSSLNTIPHLWKTGDRYFKIAFDHYGDSKLWWVIAWFNRKPTESDVNFGDVIYVPHPLDRILSYLGV
jgi:hypothetical protein